MPRSFYARPTLVVARELLGKTLVKREPRGWLSGIIVEVEAYIGPQDLACHARAGRTRRNAVMWGDPGISYVYFTYGMHWLLNVVTEPEGSAAAVLIRGLVARQGIDVMTQRRGGRKRHLTDGPAKICQAFGLEGRHNGLDLCAADTSLFVSEGTQFPDERVELGPRVGIDSVPEPWKSIPWRFRIPDPARHVGLPEAAAQPPEHRTNGEQER